jgi:hypothetical protein
MIPHENAPTLVSNRPLNRPIAACSEAATTSAQNPFAHPLAAHQVATYAGSLAAFLQQVLGEPVWTEPRPRREEAAADLGAHLRQHLQLQDTDRVVQWDSALLCSQSLTLALTRVTLPMGRHPLIDGLLTEVHRRPLGAVVAEALPECRWHLLWSSTRSWSRAWLPQGRHCIRRRLVVGMPGQPPLLHLDTAVSPHLIAPTAVDLANAS